MLRLPPFDSKRLTQAAEQAISRECPGMVKANNERGHFLLCGAADIRALRGGQSVLAGLLLCFYSESHSVPATVSPQILMYEFWYQILSLPLSENTLLGLDVWRVSLRADSHGRHPVEQKTHPQETLLAVGSSSTGHI